jgi:multiple sugar transport system ATP-binding protein
MSHIILKSLRKEFNVPSGVEVAVDSVDIELEDAEFFTLVGPSGCGKTTTLRCIAGLEMPTSGTIEIGGRDVTDVPANKRNLAMMFQNIALYPHMTVTANIAYPLKVDGVPRDEREEEARRVAALMQVDDLMDKYPGELSGGQRQRVALARTIIQDPEGFLMDEPLSDLDAKLKVQMRKEIQQVHRQINKTTVYVTHDQEEALTMSDRIAVMNNGRIEQLGTPDELYENPVNRFVAEFIGTPSMNFVTGTVRRASGDVCEFSFGDNRIELEIDGDFPSDSRITLGCRPEAVELDSNHQDGNLTGTIQLIERIDDRRLVSIETEAGEIRATQPADSALEEGETVDIIFDPRRVYFFDADTGDRITFEKKQVH